MSGQDLQQGPPQARSLESRLAAYVAVAGAATTLLSDADAAIVANMTPQAIGINGDVDVDWNSDGQIDWQIDHDRVNLDGSDLDYLQIDKNDVNSAADPLPVDTFPGGHYTTFPTNGTNPNNDGWVLSLTDGLNTSGGYAVALKAGDMIGGVGAGSLIEGTKWDYQETANYNSTNTYMRANRLLDEDAGKIDINAGRAVTAPFGPQPEYPELEDFVGLEGETRYLGLRVDLNDALSPGLNDPNMDPQYAEKFYYGWIGVQIDNEADATGMVTGWAYESTPGMPIAAGDIGPVVANADYDDDGDVDGNDFLVWQRAVGASVANGSGADGNGNGVVDGPDLDLWETQYGTAVAAPAGQAGSAAVPEPGSMLMTALCAVMAIALVFTKRRQQKAALAPCRA
jgi:hypothetical protein